MLGLASASMMSLTSNATQRILSQANNISYAFRDSYRMGTVPENRKADYMFRHFYMVPICAILTELGFRMAEVGYSLPQMTKVLGLKTLSQTYGPESDDVIGSFKHLKAEDFPKFQSLQEIPFLKSRLTGSLARESSTVLIPDLVKDVDLAPLSSEAKKKYDVLVHHLTRLMNFDTEGGFLDQVVKEGRLTLDEATQVKQALKEIQGMKDLGSALSKMSYASESTSYRLAESEAKTVKSAFEMFKKFLPEAHGKLQGIEGRFQHYLKDGLSVSGSELQVIRDGVEALNKPGTMLERILQSASDKVKALTQEGLANKLKVLELKAIQKNSFWPKMIATTALNFVLYGVLQSWLDVNVIQPWQKKLFEARGTTNEVVTPVYWGLIPFGLTLGGLMSDRIAPKFIQKLGHVGRFAFAGSAAIVAYTGTALGLSAYRLSKPPKNPLPSERFGEVNNTNPALMGASPLLGSNLHHPRGFQSFEQARRMS